MLENWIFHAACWCGSCDKLRAIDTFPPPPPAFAMALRNFISLTSCLLKRPKVKTLSSLRIRKLGRGSSQSLFTSQFLWAKSQAVLSAFWEEAKRENCITFDWILIEIIYGWVILQCIYLYPSAYKLAELRPGFIDFPTYWDVEAFVRETTLN